MRNPIIPSAALKSWLNKPMIVLKITETAPVMVLTMVVTRPEMISKTEEKRSPTPLTMDDMIVAIEW